jgi:hypothetical protein
MWGRRPLWRRLSSLGALYPLPSAQPNRAAAPKSGASRQACHAGGHAGRATQSRTVREFQSPTAAKTGGVARTPPRSTSTRRRNVEQAARLAMPAVTPAEQHHPERYGSPNRQPPPRLAAWHAGLRAPPQPAPATWSKPPGLPCRPTPAEPHNPDLYGGINVIRPARPRTPPRPAPSLPISVSSVFSVVCFFCALRVVSDVGQAF